MLWKFLYSTFQVGLNVYTQVDQGTNMIRPRTLRPRTFRPRTTRSRTVF
jgi:hypothetical protein